MNNSLIKQLIKKNKYIKIRPSVIFSKIVGNPLKLPTDFRRKNTSLHITLYPIPL